MGIWEIPEVNGLSLDKAHMYQGIGVRNLEQEGLIASNPLAHIKAPKIEYKAIQALNPDDMQKLLKKCPLKTALGCRNRAILLTLLDSGVRVSELASLELPDIDMTTGAILVRHGKGGKQRIARILGRP